MARRARNQTGPVRDPARPLRYRPFLQLVDGAAGRRDGRADARAHRLAEHGPGEESDRPVCARMWLARNEHTFLERDRREFLEAQAQAAPQTKQLASLLLAAEHAGKLGQGIHDRVSSRPQEPDPALLEVRRPGEGGSDKGVVAARRRAEYLGELGRERQAAADAFKRQAELLEQAETIRGSLELLFEVTRTRSQRLREFHQRRAATYLRAYRRAANRRIWPVPAIGTTDLPVPAWTTQPCPWFGRSVPVAAGR